MRGIGMFASSLLLLFSAQVLPAPAGHPLPAGSTETVLALRPLIDMSEGIAIDSRGHIFIGNRRLENDTRVSEILEIGIDGATNIFATLDSGVVDDFAAGVSGLAFDARGDLYAALPSFHPATHGVWRIRRNGEAERLAGSKQMPFVNALAFDSQGNLYATDSIGGAIWRFPREGRGQAWIRHPLLAPDPAIGANGIAFVPPNNLYVANTDRALIARIRILPDGTPSEPEIAAAGFELLGIDGLAADERGMLHACIVVSVALGTSPLVEVDPEKGKITSSTADESAFDLPTSLAFGRGPLDHKSIYIVNSGFFPEERPEAAPGAIRVAVGVPGAPPAATKAMMADGPGQVGFQFGLDLYRALESDGVIRIPVLRSDGSQGAVSVRYDTTHGSATSGADFAASSGTLNWADGESGIKMAQVTLLEDAAVESDEGFQLNLSNPTGGATIHLLVGRQFIEILDDDAGLGMASEAAAAIESDGSVDIAVSRMGPATGAVSVNYATSPGSATAGSDFTSASGTLDWADGDSAQKTIRVSITGDSADESNETFTVSLSNPSRGTTLGSNFITTVTIVDDDASAGGGGGGDGGGGGAINYLAMFVLAFLTFLRRRRPVHST